MKIRVEKIVEVDLRNLPSICNSRPVAVLVNSLHKLFKDGVEECMFFNVGDIPENVIRFARRIIE